VAQPRFGFRPNRNLALELGAKVRDAGLTWHLGSWLDPKQPHEAAVELERQAFLKGYYSAFGLACGPCPYCDECNLEECVHPDLARPSMEACGIDVYATVRRDGFDLEVVKSRDEKPTYFALLLVK